MRKRSKYRPKPVLADPLKYVVEGLQPVSTHESYWLDLRIRNSAAMAALFKGQATEDDMTTLIAMHNVCEGMWQMGLGKDYSDVLIRGKVALLDVGARERFILKAPEMQALNDLMELHDAQMEVSTVKDLERAVSLARHQILTGKAQVIKRNKS